MYTSLYGAIFVKFLFVAIKPISKSDLWSSPYHIGYACVSHKLYERAGFTRISAEELPVAYTYPDRDSRLYLLEL